MVSLTELTVSYAFSVLFLCCPQLLGAATNAQASQWDLERLAATALFPAVVVTLVLTPLLSFAHVWAIGRGGAAGDRRLVTGLAKATFLAATVALLASAVLLLGADGAAVVQIGADGHLDRGRGDVARLNINGTGTPCCCRNRGHLDGRILYEVLRRSVCSQTRLDRRLSCVV